MSLARFLLPVLRWACLFSGACAAAGSDAPAPSALEPIAPITAPFPMPPLARPVFPARIVDVRDHGAVAGGEVKNTATFAAAIAACADAGGGRVLVPAGKWLTGPIHLRSHIELHLAEGAEIIFSDRFEDYLPVVLVRAGGVELYNYSPLVYARDCTDVAITGPGRLNGNAQAWWAWKTKETRAQFQLAHEGVPVEQRIFGTPEAAIRPNFVVFYNCRNVLLEGFTIGGGPNWTIHPVYCEDVIIRRVNVLTDGPNNDGIDPDSCRNVLIEHCVFDTGDDCVVLKSGYNEDGWRVARPMENLVMRWCSARRGHGGLVIGSEMSGDVRNVYVHDCEFTGTDRMVRIKSRRGRGGVVENVWAENLRGSDLLRDVVIMNLDYGADTNRAFTEKAPIFRNLHLRHLVGHGAPTAIRLAGLEDAMIQNVTFDDLEIDSTEGVVAANIQGITFTNVTIRPARGPVYQFDNARDVLIRHPGDSGAATPFASIAGAGSARLRIETNSPSSPVVVRGPGVSEDAVSITTGGEPSRAAKP